MPAYTGSLRQAGGAGRVNISVVVDRFGKLANARIVDGDPRLFEISVQALKQWRWRTSLQAAQKLDLQSTVVFEYKADTGEVLINPALPAEVDIRKALSAGQHQ